MTTSSAAEGRTGSHWEQLENLEAQELRLYALGWGDHLPVELLDRIEQLREQRLALEAELAGLPWTLVAASRTARRSWPSARRGVRSSSPISRCARLDPESRGSGYGSLAGAGRGI